MFKNYLMTALRNILSNKLFSLINIIGLSIGLAAVFLITLYAWDEITYDSYFDNGENIYKLETRSNSASRGIRNFSVTGAALVEGLVNEHSEMVKLGANYFNGDRIITLDNTKNSEEAYFTQQSFFDIFQLEFLEGSAENPLPDLSSVTISESASLKYFGTTTSLGKILELDDGNSYRVTSVFRDLPRNTHFRPNFIFPSKINSEYDLNNTNGWYSFGYKTYVILQDGKTIEDLQNAINATVNKYVEPRNPDTIASDQYNYTIIPLKDVHFQTSARDKGNPMMLLGFGIIAIIILSIATLNFMNMSLSRTITRAKEVAVRKALGASKNNILSQFLSETFLTVIVALFLALVITEISLPMFNEFVSKIIESGQLISPLFLFGILALIVLIGLGAGIYPASIMSNFRPAMVLGGGNSENPKLSKFRMFLVTGQFAVAIGLMVTASIVFQQINYSQNMDPGYVKENVLLIHDLEHESVNPSVITLKNRLLENPDITSVALIDQAPGGTYGWISGLNSIDGVAVQDITLRGMIIDNDFIDTFGMNLKAGRTLSTERSTDIARPWGAEEYNETTNVLINEKAAQNLGFSSPEDAIGKSFNDGTESTIVGVVGDFLIGSSKSTVPAMYYIIDEPGYRIAAIKFRTNNIQNLSQSVDEIWSEISQGRPIKTEFFDDRIAKLYQIEAQQGEIFALFAGLAILVSCIGLYGLASFSVARRTKEIGIRKVMGANIPTIARQILWDFSKPVLIANLIAWPLAWYFMSDWLLGFNYRIDLTLLPFIAAGIGAILIAWVTVGVHVLKVARTNPIVALRYE